MPREYSPIDPFISPVWNLGQTVANLPFLNQTGLGEWLRTDEGFEGVRNFREAEPGWAGGIDALSTLAPFIGYYGALNRAGVVGRGLLPTTNRAGVAAAGAFRSSPSLAFAAGETVRQTPFLAGITALDAAGGKFETIGDAAGSLLGLTALNLGAGWAGHALSPFVQRHAPAAIGDTWKAVFEPHPELAAMYGFSNNQVAAASTASRFRSVQEAVDPAKEAQERARAMSANIRGIEDGSLPEAAELAPIVDTLKALRDQDIHTILVQGLNADDAGFRFRTDPGLIRRNSVRGVLGEGPTHAGTRVTQGLTGGMQAVNSLDNANRMLGLPEDWVYDAVLPRMTQAVRGRAADRLRGDLGLAQGVEPGPWRRIERTGPNGERQLWSIMQEEDGGWMLATEVAPPDPTKPWTMNWRQRFEIDGSRDAADMFFTFKTTNPQRLFENEGWRFDIDDPSAPAVGETLGSKPYTFESRIPSGASPLLDRILDFKNLYLGKATLRAAHTARASGPRGAERVTKALLEGPTAGKAIANTFDTYASPADAQLKRSPEGRGLIGMWRAMFDYADGMKQRMLYGSAAIPEDKNAITALFATPDMNDAEALVAALRKTALEDSGVVEVIRRYQNSDVPLDSLAGTKAGAWLKLAHEANDKLIGEINKAIGILRDLGAVDARLIPTREGHFGISRKWDGSYLIPVYRGNQVEPDAVIAGGSMAHAKRKAEAWLKARAEDLARRGEAPEQRRLGDGFVIGLDKEVPKWANVTALNPSLLEPRAGMMGWENQYEPWNHLDDLVKALDEGYTDRLRYGASVIAKGLTDGPMSILRHTDPEAFRVVAQRVEHFLGREGAASQRLNQLVDQVAAPWLGTKSVTKTVKALNGTMFHLLHGAGNIATPLLNLTGYLQTALPRAVEFLTSSPAQLRQLYYQMPAFGADGLPTRGFNYIVDPGKLIKGGVDEAISDDPRTRAVFQDLFNDKEMGANFSGEYTGQERTVAARMAEGIRGPEDVAYWAERMSSFLMAKSEQVSRTLVAGMSIKASKLLEEFHGTPFTHEQMVNNAKIMIRGANAAYMPQDRPLMFTSPGGELFGNQKTWMMNYMFEMARYTGLGVKHGNWAPLMFSAGTSALLGGVLAVPLIGAGMDVFTKTFLDKDATEVIFERFGEGGNGIAFGLPALFGMSLTGNVSAPGSNLAHDSEFFFTIVALERAKLLGRAVGRAWDDQTVLGMNPMNDELWRKQALQALAPRALYRGAEALFDDSLRSAATGYPLVNEFGFGARVMHGLGFRDVDIATQYTAYERLLKDRDEGRRVVGLFGEAYANAMLNGDRREQQRLLMQVATMGVDLSSVMRSAQVRMRNAGTDMFGRGFTGAALERQQETLRAGGRALEDE